MVACLFLGLGHNLHALPPMQHPVNGIVRSVDVAKGILALDPGEKDNPTEFTIVAGRTKFSRDKKPATLGDLNAGQKVHLYYRHEMGCDVATEVTWTSPTTDAPREKRTVN